MRLTRQLPTPIHPRRSVDYFLSTFPPSISLVLPSSTSESRVLREPRKQTPPRPWQKIFRPRDCSVRISRETLSTDLLMWRSLFLKHSPRPHSATFLKLSKTPPIPSALCGRHLLMLYRQSFSFPRGLWRRV